MEGGSFEDIQTKAKLVGSNLHITGPGHMTPYGALVATGLKTQVCAQGKALLCILSTPGAPRLPQKVLLCCRMSCSNVF